MRGSGGVEAGNVVLPKRGKTVIQIMNAVLGTVAALRANRIAILEVADLVGESDVVSMGCPRHSCVLAGGGIDRMKVGRNVVRGRIAVCSSRIEQNFTELVGGARCHRASLAGR